MPYNTRRKSISLPSLGIHVPMSNAARAAKSAGRSATSSSTSASTSPPTASTSPSQSSSAHPNKRIKRSNSDANNDISFAEATPPPSPTPAMSVDMSDVDTVRKIDLDGINDDIVEGVITELESTANRPHLVKELAIVLALSLSSVQNSANQCAIISSRLASYMKRSCWSALSPCPLAKELEAVHPRRTYYYLTTCTRQAIPEPGSIQPLNRASVITPSVSLTDDSGSEDVDGRRRELSPSPELDLPPPDFEALVDSDPTIITPPGSLPKTQFTPAAADARNQTPALEKDEREFTQTANGLLKRKLTDDTETVERTVIEYGYRDDIWSGDYRAAPTTSFLTSPAMKPILSSGSRKEDELNDWLKFNLLDWDKGAESIEIEELDYLLDGC